MSVKIQLRRDTASVWASNNPILALGEPGFETDTNQFKIGDGTTSWTSLDYMRQDFVSVVAPTGIASLTSPQQSGIKEGSLVLTTDGYRWFYTGSGSKTSEASYVQMADINPDWTQVASRPSGLLSIAGLTTGSGNYLYATASNVYTTGVITAFGRSLIDDTDASTGRSTLGIVAATTSTQGIVHLADSATALEGTDSSYAMTAAGTAISRRGSGRSKMWEIFHDFGPALMSGSEAGGSDGFIWQTSTSSASFDGRAYYAITGNPPSNSGDYHAGVLKITTSSSTGYGVLFYGSSSVISDPMVHRIDTGKTFAETMIYIPAISSASGQFAIRFGYLGSTSGPGSSNGGCWIEYNVTQSAIWQGCVYSSSLGGIQRTSIGLTVATGWHKLSISLDGTYGGSVYPSFAVDAYQAYGSTAATTLSSYPGRTNALGLQLQQTSYSSGTYGAIFCDYVYSSHKFNGDRTA